MKKKILINVEATSRCPASCSMCPRDLIHTHGNMELKTMEKVVSQVNSDYVWELDLAGRGEPTIHPEFAELISLMKVPNVKSCVVTTGVTLTQKNIDAIVNGVDVVRLSVSSRDQKAFEKVHIGLKYEKIWANIAALAEAAPEKVTVHLTGGPAIYDGLPQTVQHLRSLGLKRMYLFPLWNRGGFFDSRIETERRKSLMESLEIPPSESEYSSGGKLAFWADLAVGKLKNSTYCPVGDSSMSVAYDGSVLGCFQDFGHSSLLGSIWKTPIYEQYVERKKILGKMKVCVGCDSYKVALI